MIPFRRSWYGYISGYSVNMPYLRIQKQPGSPGFESKQVQDSGYSVCTRPGCFCNGKYVQVHMGCMACLRFEAKCKVYTEIYYLAEQAGLASGSNRAIQGLDLDLSDEKLDQKLVSDIPVCTYVHGASRLSPPFFIGL